ncbi:hypothetical protein M5689_000078 [Euphorbia peplus]|nr:hypothetical protein M5689_000078 [Euphorbia peplus]
MRGFIRRPVIPVGSQIRTRGGHPLTNLIISGQCLKTVQLYQLQIGFRAPQAYLATKTAISGSYLFNVIETSFFEDARDSVSDISGALCKM